MKNRSAIVASIVGVVLLALIAVFAFSGDHESKDTNQLVGRPVPTIDTLDTEGRPFRTADYRGRFLLVNFFGTWCPPCIAEHPELVRFAETHDRLGDASVVSIAYQDTPEKVAQFFADNGGDWAVLNAEDTRLVVEFGVVAMPESYLVAPDGTVLHKFVGNLTAAQVEAEMEKYA
ncbi:MAG: redoxin family protein [Actinobacteria bacterium]|nr:redoxin family protein [Actinomycetota bacterium]